MPLPTLVGLGEILWDLFPDGPRFGGAPANFACTAAELGARVATVEMVSAVGTDPLGDQALAALRQHGVQVSAVPQLDFPTGTVLVELDPRGQATYSFASNTAWDNLAWTPTLAELASRTSLVCFGTLGQRAAPSLATIRRFVEATPATASRLLDINLRPPHWNAAVVHESLPLANVVKLNDQELAELSPLLDLTGPEPLRLEQLLRRYDLRLVALTRGERGSVLLSATGERSELPGEPVTVADTVGAGDAFSAALALGLVLGHPLADIHRRASCVAAYVCTQSGATPGIPTELRL
ncbi:MAG: carbohydrate kinase family protein [Planctomycetaceae bacterium]|jgi:fructokinase